jgi:hypothetical protein
MWAIHYKQITTTKMENKYQNISQCRSLGSKKTITDTKFASILGKIKWSKQIFYANNFGGQE